MCAFAFVDRALTVKNQTSIFDVDALGVRDKETGIIRVAHPDLLEKLPYGRWYFEMLQGHFMLLPCDVENLVDDSRETFAPLQNDTLYDVPFEDAFDIVVGATDSFTDHSKLHPGDNNLRTDNFCMYFNAGLRRIMDEGKTPVHPPKITITMARNKIYLVSEKRLF